MLRYLPLVLAVALVVYSVFDVLGSDARARRGLPVPLWLAVVLLLPVVGSVTWLVVSRVGRASGAARGPVAPDDDPEFLRRLDQERRRREQERRGDPRDGDGSRDGDGVDDGDAAGTTDGTA